MKNFVKLGVLALLMALPSLVLAAGPPPPSISSKGSRVNIFDQPNFIIKSRKLNTRGDYISAGVKYIDLGNFSVDNDGGEPLTLEYESTPILYQAALGNAWDSSILRFRYDIEVYFNKLDIELKRDSVSVEGKMEAYGLNLNFFYDLPTMWNFLTPYGGISGMLLGLRLQLDDSARISLNSPTIGALLGSNTDNTRGFNVLYGYGLTGGLRWELASWLALDTGYRLIRFEDCVQSRGCALLQKNNIHEGKVDLVIRF